MKIYPNDKEIEEGVLSALITFSSSFAEVAHKLKPEMFYVDRHVMIYKAIAAIHSRGEGIDLLTVTAELRAQGKLEEVGGVFAVTRMAGMTVSNVHLEYHVAILRDFYLRRRTIRITQEGLALALDLTQDFYEGVTQTLEKLGSIEEELDTGTLHDMAEVMEATLRQADERIRNNREGITGVPTGLNELDRITAGFQNTDLIVLGARPSMGKTAISLLMALEAAKAGRKVMFFSMEMSKERLGDRWLIGETGIDPDKWRAGQVTPEERKRAEEAATEFEKLPIQVDDNSSMSIEYIRSRARTQHRKGKCDMVFVDYLQLGDIKSEHANSTRTIDIGEVTKKAKRMAKELNIPVVMLSQLNRDSEKRNDKRPILADLRESGNIEQDADLVLLIHNPEKAGLTKEEKSGYPVKGLGVLIIAKNRNGTTGEIYFGYNESMTRIGDYTPPLDWMKENAKEVKAKELRKSF